DELRFVGEMPIGRLVRDAGQAGSLAQAQRRHTVLFDQMDSSGHEGTPQIAVVVRRLLAGAQLVLRLAHRRHSFPLSRAPTSRISPAIAGTRVAFPPRSRGPEC